MSMSPRTNAMPRPVPRPAVRAGAPVASATRRVAGLAAGAVTGVAEFGFLCVVGVLFAVLAAWPAGRRAARRFAAAGTARLVALERARLATWFGHDTGGVPVGSGYGYLALRATFGTFASYLTFAGLFVGLLFLFGGVGELLSGASYPVPLRYPGVRLTVDSGPLGTAYGLVLLGLSALWGSATVAAERRLAAYFAGPGERETMRRRIAELTATRSGIVRAVDDERRRIERDLHDGVQQRGVALGMLLGRARHGADPAAVAALVDQAYAESRRLLDELRDVAWRVYPAALDELGLRAALAGVAERAGVPVTVRYGLTERPVSEIETAVYFVVREAIANAAKHADARGVLVVLSEDGHAVTAEITDDGRGGADPAGGGLSGLERRVLALDGAFEVDSPPGGPTRVTATLPRCGSERPEPSCA
ncbi:sensor histidine kinase [Streptosporangium sp. NBC_01469]|uniref:sensor histidine kinase n=1 Tax=Streptosporangium sp. NBC_01469 TaxID=2903898 RepID=UPI002E2DF226|nr:histidine kinase [Streptosporangium sp. NBC_01469]